MAVTAADPAEQIAAKRPTKALKQNLHPTPIRKFRDNLSNLKLLKSFFLNFYPEDDRLEEVQQKPMKPVRQLTAPLAMATPL